MQLRAMHSFSFTHYVTVIVTPPQAECPVQQSCMVLLAPRCVLQPTPTDMTDQLLSSATVLGRCTHTADRVMQDSCFRQPGCTDPDLCHRCRTVPWCCLQPLLLHRAPLCSRAAGMDAGRVVAAVVVSCICQCCKCLRAPGRPSDDSFHWSWRSQRQRAMPAGTP